MEGKHKFPTKGELIQYLNDERVTVRLQQNRLKQLEDELRAERETRDDEIAKLVNDEKCRLVAQNEKMGIEIFDLTEKNEALEEENDGLLDENEYLKRESKHLKETRLSPEETASLRARIHKLERELREKNSTIENLNTLSTILREKVNYLEERDIKSTSNDAPKPKPFLSNTSLVRASIASYNNVGAPQVNRNTGKRIVSNKRPLQSNENEDPSYHSVAPAKITKRPNITRRNNVSLSAKTAEDKAEAEKAEQQKSNHAQPTPVEVAPVESLPSTTEKGVGECPQTAVPSVTTDQAIDISGTLSNESSQATTANPSQSTQENTSPMKADPEVEQVEDFTHLLFPSVQAFKDTTNIAVTQEPITKQVQHTHGAGQTCRGCDKFYNNTDPLKSVENDRMLTGKARIQLHSKHRTNSRVRQTTPEGFWDISFPSITKK